MSSRFAGGRAPSPESRAPVSVVITARDEEGQLPGALASVTGWAAEVVVVLDPRSNDRSGELARQAGAQCNWGLDQCAHRWAFVLDADERVTAQLAAAILQVVREPRHAAYAVRRTNHAFGRRLRFGDWGHDRVVRLLDRERASFSELSVHGAVQAASVGLIACDLHHDTLRSLTQYLPKLHDYALRGAADLAAAGRRASVLKAIAHAEWRFFRGFVLRLGALDGPAGWAVAILTAYGTYLKWLAAWDLQRVLPPAAGSGAPSPEPRAPAPTATGSSA